MTGNTPILDDRMKAQRDRQSRFCRLVFLMDNDEGHQVHCRETEDWTVCRINPVSSYSGYGAQSFTTSQTYERNALLALLEQAYERGREDKAREIRQVLEIAR